MSWKRKFVRNWGRLGMRFKTEKLGDFLYVKGRIGWKGLKKDEYLSDGVYRIINGEALTKDGIDWSKAGFISKERYEESPEIMLQNDDILISKDGTIGKLGFVRNLENPSTVASGIFVLRNLKPEMINIRFIYNYLSSVYFRNFIISRTEGSVIPHLYQKDFVDLYFPLPSLKEQNKIVDVLDTISCKIEINKMINNNLEQQAQSIYKQMFIDNASSDWTEGILSDIADITMGQSPSSSSYNEDRNGIIFFQGRAEFGFRFPTVRLYTTEPKRMACTNDTLMSVRAPVGDLNVAHTDCCIGRGLAAIHSKDNHQAFVLYTMFSLKKQLDVFNGEGTVFGSINRISLNKMPLLIPSSEKLDEFEALVSPIDAAIRNNYDEICYLKQLRDSLLPKLMSGELDVSNIDF